MSQEPIIHKDAKVGVEHNAHRAQTTHPLLILKHLSLQVGISMSATLEAPKAAQIAKTNVTTEVAETDGHPIKSELDPLQEEVSTSL